MITIAVNAGGTQTQAKIAEHYQAWARAAAIGATAAFALHHQVAPRDRWMNALHTGAMYDAQLLDINIGMFIDARRAQVRSRDCGCDLVIMI